MGAGMNPVFLTPKPRPAAPKPAPDAALSALVAVHPDIDAEEIISLARGSTEWHTAVKFLKPAAGQYFSGYRKRVRDWLAAATGARLRVADPAHLHARGGQA
jgi:hypothetical protein